MKLNRELSTMCWKLSQLSWLDDSFGCEEIHLALSYLTPTSGALRDYNRAFFAKLRRRRKVLKHPRTPTSGAS